MQKVRKIRKVKSKIKKIEKSEAKKEEQNLEDVLDLDAEDDSFDLDSPTIPVRKRAPAPQPLKSEEFAPMNIESSAEESPRQQNAQGREQARERGYVNLANPDDNTEDKNKYLITSERTTPIIRPSDEERGVLLRGRESRGAFQSEAVNRLAGRGEGSEETTHSYELKEKAKEKESKRKLPWEI